MKGCGVGHLSHLEEEGKEKSLNAALPTFAQDGRGNEGGESSRSTVKANRVEEERRN